MLKNQARFLMPPKQDSGLGRRFRVIGFKTAPDNQFRRNDYRMPPRLDTHKNQARWLNVFFEKSLARYCTVSAQISVIAVVSTKSLKTV